MSKSPLKNKKAINTDNNDNHENDILRCIVCCSKIYLFDSKHTCVFRNIEKISIERS